MDDEAKEVRRALRLGTARVVEALQPSGLLPSGVGRFMSVGEVGLALEGLFHLLQSHEQLRELLSPDCLAFLSDARAALESDGGYTVPSRQDFRWSEP